MKKIFIFIFFLIGGATVNGQDYWDIDITAEQEAEIFPESFKEIEKVANNFLREITIKSNLSTVEEGVIRVPVAFWVYRSDEGEIGLPNYQPLPNDETFQIIIDYLNLSFKNNSVNIRFYMLHQIGYIDDDEHLEVTNPELFMLGETHKIQGTLNIHIVQNILQGAGIATPTQYVFIQRNIIGDIQVTSHEVGHYFGLAHTFRYTENDVKCLREPVTRDRIWYCGSYIKACEITGDFLCDTPADPFINTSQNGCAWIGTETDWRGDAYSPDVTNYMSYYTPRTCLSTFSKQQATKMLYTANLINGIYWRPTIRNSFDIYEPDNSNIMAREIIIGETQLHTFHWITTGQMNLYNYNDIDWYFFNLEENKEIVIYTENYINHEVKTKIIIYDENLNQISESSIIETKPKVYLEDYPAGKYFIQITLNTDDISLDEILDYTVTIDDCVENEVCEAGIIDTDVIYQAKTMFSAPCDNNVFSLSSTSNVLVFSENIIELKSGFTANRGSEFIAEITGINCLYSTTYDRVYSFNGQEQILEEKIKDPENTLKSTEQTEQIEDIFNQCEISVFPNPVKSSVIVNYFVGNEEQTVIKIYNIFGQLEETIVNEAKQKGEYSAEVDISGFPSGIYLVTMQNGKYTKSLKLVKK